MQSKRGKRTWRRAEVLDRKDGVTQEECQVQIKYVGSVLPAEWIPALFGGADSRLRYAISVIGPSGAPEDVAPATVHGRRGALVLVHYDTQGYDKDEWLPEDSPRIHWTAAGGRPAFGKAASGPSTQAVSQTGPSAAARSAAKAKPTASDHIHKELTQEKAAFEAAEQQHAKAKADQAAIIAAKKKKRRASTHKKTEQFETWEAAEEARKKRIDSPIRTQQQINNPNILDSGACPQSLRALFIRGTAPPPSACASPAPERELK